MFDFIKDNLILNDPLILGANISIVFTVIGIVAVLTYFKKWKWLWTNGSQALTIKKSVLCILSQHFSCYSVEESMRS